MMTLTVAHYLNVFQLKKAMMEEGTTTPSAEGREFVARLAKCLGELDPSLPCDVSTGTDSDNNTWLAYTVDGVVIARADLGRDVG